jgi:hypothetical protein
VPVFVHAQPASNDREPGVKGTAALGRVGAQALAVAALERFDHEGVAIHHCIVPATQRPRDPQNHFAVPAEEGGPRPIPPSVVGGRDEGLKIAR